MNTIVSMTRRSIVVTLVAGLAMALLMSTAPIRTAPAAQSVLDYTPTTGATFNRPVGTQAEQRAIFRHVNNAIDATPPGETIRFAVYSFAEKSTAQKLIAAKQRGVNVQVIFNGHEMYPAEKMLVSALGTKTSRSSFALDCAGSCRGGTGNMHQKMFLFSQSGRAENVVMMGSNNMTLYNAVKQWSDVYTVVDDPALYFTFVGVFDQMRQDTRVAQPYIGARINSYEPEFYPYPGLTQENDPLYKALSQISCIGAAEGFGAPGKTDSNGDGVIDRVTVVRLSQHAWNGDRGRYLAVKVADLKRAGCDVKVIYGVGFGRAVRNALTNAGVPLSQGSVKGVHTHQKVMMVSGVYGGDPASTRVWNGSHNWSSDALKRDDTVLCIDSAEAFSQYFANFEDVWNNG